MNAMQRVQIQGDGVELAAYCWGNAEGPPLLLVHGYPDNHSVWLPLIRALQGSYRIIAYDVRGFGASARPHTRRGYHLEKLANDLEAVINATSPDQPVHLIAHDWGSIQAWEAVTEPRIQPLLASYTSISGPCLDHVGHWMRERFRQKRPGALLELTGQLLSSWYIALFHLPWLPELTWRLGLDKAWPRLLHRLEGIRHAAPNPSQRADGMHGVQLYRANFIRSLLRPRLRHTRVPVQLIVPTRDRFVRPQLFDQLERWAPDLRRREVKAGHWQLLAEPGQLAEWLRAFIAEVDAVQAQAPRRRTGS